MPRRARRFRSRTVAALLLAVTGLAVPLGAGPVTAAVGDPALDQCFSGAVLAGCTATTPAFSGSDVEMSPDGKQVYMVSVGAPAIRIFDRGPFNKLEPRSGPSGCYNANGADSCTVVPNLSASFDITVSPDGTSVYVATVSNLLSLSRSATTGTLTPGPCYGPAPGCVALPQLSSAIAVVVSPDGRNVYVRGGSRLLVFDRNTATGGLTVKPGVDGCFSETPVAGCTDAVGLANNSFEMPMSSDGKFLYVSNQSPGGIGFFIRGSDGTLSQLAGPQGGCITTDGSSSAAGECATLPGGSGPAMGNSWAATISPSGKHVFVSGMSGTVAFARAADTGKLTKTDCVAPGVVPGCQQKPGSAGMGVEISPDSTRAVVGSNDVGGVGVYAFNEANGTLSQLPGQLACFSASSAPACTSVPGGFGQYGKAAWAPNGLNVYFAAGGPLLNLAVDAAPKCQPVSSAVGFNTPTKLQLSCSDPNGDAVTINAPAQSSAGQLGAVDQATGTVLFSPLNGYSGPDTFTYTATAKGVTSVPATVSLTVQPAPPPPPPPPAPDTQVTLTIGTKTLTLNDKSKATVKLTCPTAEKSGPCTGTLKVKTRGKVPVDGKKKVVVLATAKFSVATGTTKAVTIKLSTKYAKLVRKVADARKLKLVAKVKDTVGNKATVTTKATLKLP